MRVKACLFVSLLLWTATGSAQPAQTQTTEPYPPAAMQPAPPPPPPPEPSGRDIVFAYNRGLRYGIAPGVFVPLHGGPVGFSIAGTVRYGFELGPLVLAPGARLGAFWHPDFRVLWAMGTARVTVPIGPVGPYVVGGVGPGWLSTPSQVDLAYLGGGGFMVYIGTHFGVGAEATYQGLRGTNFAGLFFGPLLMFAW